VLAVFEPTEAGLDHELELVRRIEKRAAQARRVEGLADAREHRLVMAFANLLQQHARAE
jgi:hypothetical protein